MSKTALTKGQVHPGIKALRRAIRAKRWDNQGGYAGASDNVPSIGLDLAAEDLQAVLALVGMEMDAIDPAGSCEDCLFSTSTGRERGYAFPCNPCKRPYHSHFVQITPGPRRKLLKAEREKTGIEFGQYLQDVHKATHKPHTPKKAPRVKPPERSVG